MVGFFNLRTIETRFSENGNYRKAGSGGQKLIHCFHYLYANRQQQFWFYALKYEKSITQYFHCILMQC